eukprot:scaffold4204_cov140-Isochrysis_galbana.AAC.10
MRHDVDVRCVRLRSCDNRATAIANAIAIAVSEGQRAEGEGKGRGSESCLMFVLVLQTPDQSKKKRHPPIVSETL